MRKQMNEAFLKEEKKQHLSERNEYADRLYEKWMKKGDVGKGMEKIREANEAKARNLAIVLQNEENHLKALTETQISNDFQTTPQNVLRIVRLGYPNSVRGDIFQDYPMVTARDSIYYLEPIYTSTARGATSGDVTYESAAYRYASEAYEHVADISAEGSETSFSGTITETPIRPHTAKIFVGNKPVGRDDGSGSFENLTGETFLNTSGTNTIDYDTGSYTFTLASADTVTAGDRVFIYFHTDTEDETDGRDRIQSVELQLTDYQLRARPYPLYVSWSKMAELLLGTTLNVDAEENLIRGAGDEMKKSLDYLAVRMGYRYAHLTDQTTFDADFATAGADSEKAHAQSLTKTIKQGSNVIYNALNRGGINQLVAGTGVAAFLTLHDQFVADNVQPQIGIHRIGSLLGKPVYQAPNDVVPSDEMLGVWRNPNADGGDYSLVFGTLIPLYQTQTLEYKEGYSETGLFHFGDWVPIQKKYLVRFKLNNL